MIVLSIASLLVGAVFVFYGALLVWRPILFLRYYDLFIDRSRWSKSLEWRKNVHNVEYKLLGIAFVVVGLFLMFSTLTRLITALN